MPKPTDDDPPERWDDEPTFLDAAPLAELEPEERTPPHDPTLLPGYDVGKRAGRAMGYNEAIADLRAILLGGRAPQHVVDRLADLMRQRARAVPAR